MRAGLFPLDIVLDPAATMAGRWPSSPDDPSGTRTLEEVSRAALIAVHPVPGPAHRPRSEDPKEAVCQVFEKVNTGGVALTVFELLTATYAAENFRLRNDWEARRPAAYPLLADLNATNFLQTLTLLWTYGRIRPGSPGWRVPAVSAKRRDMLALPLVEYRRWADRATDSLKQLCGFSTASGSSAAAIFPTPPSSSR